MTALVVAALPIALVVTEPDLSTAAVLCAVTASMLVLGRIPLKALALILGAAVMVLPFGEHLLHPYQQERLHSFLSGSTSANGSGWAILQMHVALGWGGLTGGAGNPLHRLVALYLPEPGDRPRVRQPGRAARDRRRFAGRRSPRPSWSGGSSAPAAARGAVPRDWPRPASRRC